MELKIPPGATSSRSLKLFLDEALSGAAGQEVSRVILRNPPESYKGEAAYLKNRAEVHGVDVGLEEVRRWPIT